MGGRLENPGGFGVTGVSSREKMPAMTELKHLRAEDAHTDSSTAAARFSPAPEIRDFMPADMEAFVTAYDEVWGWEIHADPASMERSTMALAYTLTNLLRADAARTALLPDGRPGALACMRWDASNPQTHGVEPAHRDLARIRMKTLYERCVSRLAATNLGRDCLEFEDDLMAVNHELMGRLPPVPEGGRAELIYLITVREARGLGLGKALMDDFEAACRTRGIGDAFLYTDNHCHWKIYLKRGWSIAAKKRWRAPIEDDAIESMLMRKAMQP